MGPLSLVSDVVGSRRAGIAAVVGLDGEPHLLTCGYVFKGAGPNVFSCDERGSSGDSEPIAILVKSYLDDEPPIDAALCALTEHGL